MYILSQNWRIKFSIMNKVSDVLPERFSQDPLETYFCKRHPFGAWINKLPLHNFGYVKTFWKQKVFKQIATGKVRNENIKFVSNRTSSMSEKIQTKQSFKIFKQASDTSLSYQQNKKLNEYISKLTFPYFNSFRQSFHFPFSYNFFDQRLFCFMKIFFKSCIKMLSKSRNNCLLIIR